MKNKPEPVLGVDILGLAAAFMVIGYHLGFRAFSDSDYFLNDMLRETAELEIWWPITWFGWVGVQLFFVISGFVIAFSSEGTSAERFIRSRVLRLAPGMWVCVIVCGTISAAWGIPLLKVLFLSAKTAVFLPLGPWIAGQVWTIGIELAFYAMMLFLIWKNAFKYVELLAFALLVACAGYWIAIHSGVVQDTAGRLTQLLLLQHGCYFALGLLIWLASRSGYSLARAAGAIVCIGTAWFQINAALLAESPEYGLHRFPAIPFIVWLTLVGAMSVSVFYNSRILANVRGLAPAIRTGGMMTYSLYLLHYHVGGSALVSAHRHGFGDGAALAIAIAASLAAAYGSAKLLEPIFFRMLKGWISNVIRSPLPDSSGA